MPTITKETFNTKKILDRGFVKLAGFMGGDAKVVKSARVTFGSSSKGEERDRRLIEYLLRHKHFTPFEHSIFQFHVKCPIFVARQWMRHRWGSFNEISARYTQVKDEFYIPEKFRLQDKINKQGSINAEIKGNEKLIKIYRHAIKNSYEAYLTLTKSNIAKEMARMLLPVAQYTQFYWTVNARSLLNFLTLRMDEHAQWEIRQYASAIGKIFRDKMPWTWEIYQKISAKK